MMFHLYQQDSDQLQKNLISDSLNKIDSHLKEKSTSPESAAAMERWIRQIFENTARLSHNQDLELPPPEPISLPREIKAFTIQTAIRILTMKSDLQDNALYYLNDTGSALGLESASLRNLLDDEFNKMRFEFTAQLKKELNPEQLYWCALMLLEIIYADGQVHPAEKLYFDLITELIAGSGTDLETLKKNALNPDEIPTLNLNENTARVMLKYVVTIAMCDGEYVGQESEFITKAARSLGIEPSSIDTVLQPIAASFMVLESLFPRNRD